MGLISNFYDIGKEIKRDLDKHRNTLDSAGTEAVTKAISGLKFSLRMMTLAAGLGEKIANTWRDNTSGGKRLIFPVGRKSMNAAGVIFSRAPEIISTFDKGALIRAKTGVFLALPTENTPLGTRGRRITPSTWPVDRFGELHFIPAGPDKGYLVANLIRSVDKVSGEYKGYRRATKRRKNSGRVVEQLVMYVLIRQTSIQKRFDVASEAGKWLVHMRDLFDQALTRKGR